jgi:DNA polymerase V
MNNVYAQKPILGGDILLTYVSSLVPGGFPSPADDYLAEALNLNDLIQHPSATYIAKISGDSMKDMGILDGSLVIIDRSIKPYDGCVLVALIDGEVTCKRLNQKENCLEPANIKYSPISLKDKEWCSEGVVIHTINTLMPSMKCY